MRTTFGIIQEETELRAVAMNSMMPAKTVLWSAVTHAKQLMR